MNPIIFQRITQGSILGAILLVPLVFSPWTFEAFELTKHYLLVFLVSVGLLAWMGRMILAEREITIRFPSVITIPFLLFFGFALLSLFFSLDRFASLFGFYGRFSDGLLLLVSGGLLAFLLVQEGKGMAEKAWKGILVAVTGILALSFLSLAGLWQKIGFLPPVMKQELFNPVSGSPEGLAIFLAVLFPLVFASLSLRLVPNILWKLIHWFALVASFILIAAVHSTAAWTVFIAGLLLLSLWMVWQKEFSQENPIKSFGIPAVLLLLSLILLFSPVRVAPERAEEPKLSQSHSWGIAFDTVTEGMGRFALGSGPGTWAIDFSQHKPEELNLGSLWRMRFDRAGSHLPELLATTGLAGFLSFLSLIGLFLVASFLFVSYDKRKHKEGGEEAYGNLPLLGVAMLLLAFLTTHQNSSLLLLFWALVGMGAVSWQGGREIRLSLKKHQGKRVILGALLVLCIFLFAWGAYLGSRFYLADAAYLRSRLLSPSLLDERIGALEEAARLNPSQAEYKIALAKLHLERALSELKKPQDEQNTVVASQDVQRSLAFARGAEVDGRRIMGATELSPKRVASWEAAGAVYREIQHAEGARDWGITSFEKAVALEPANPVLRVELGKLYLGKNEIEKAKREFEYAMALRPSYAEAHIQLALAEEKEGNARGAISRLQELSRQHPVNAEILFQLGKVYYNAKEFDQAVHHLREAVGLSPNHSNAHYALGSAYERQGEIALAVAEFERVAELNPGNANVMQKLQQLRGQ